jgi:ABC-type glycerol-3-phosphate transport system permease component
MSVKALPSRQARELSAARRSSLAHWLIEFAKYTILVVLSFSFLLPFYWMISSALKDDSQIYTVPPVWIPNPAFWQNFWNAWHVLDFNQMAFNTVFKYGIPSTIGTVLSSAVVAYGFARMKWPGRDFFFAICLATMMIPFQVRLVPLFIIFKNLGWVGTYLPLTVPAYFGNAFFIFMLRQFFRTIPMELSDAGKIDGANEFQILFRIILPLVKPALAVVALFSFMNAWNDYLGPLIYVNQEHQWTLALGISRMASAMGEHGGILLAYPYLMAASAIVTMPIFFAFFFAQRSFIEGISMSGLKG